MMLSAGTVCGRAAGTPRQTTEDGIWWQGLSSERQAFAVQVEMSAIQMAWSEAAVKTITVIGDELLSEEKQASLSRQQAVRIDSSIYTRMQAQKQPTFSKSVQTYVRDISRFYRGHPAAIRSPMSAVMLCLGDRPLRTCDYLAQNP
ncbi:MAG: hypothetical protein GIW99_06020 [Candidatus Eremiobacteraeota bacterium]|nr:hypothetical protein [Candidatus Eremiobacteraeota bacterium]